MEGAKNEGCCGATKYGRLEKLWDETRQQQHAERGFDRNGGR
jgi:hypothetical protein